MPALSSSQHRSTDYSIHPQMVSTYCVPGLERPSGDGDQPSFPLHPPHRFPPHSLTPASFLLLEHTWHASTSGPLHRLCPLPGPLFSQHPSGSSPTSVRSWLKCHPLRWPFLDPHLLLHHPLLFPLGSLLCCCFLAALHGLWDVTFPSSN